MGASVGPASSFAVSERAGGHFSLDNYSVYDIVVTYWLARRNNSFAFKDRVPELFDIKDLAHTLPLAR